VDLKAQNPKRESRNYNLTLITTAGPKDGMSYCGLRIANLKKELPKHESRNCNFTLIIAGLLGLQFEIRNSIFAIPKPP